MASNKIVLKARSSPNLIELADLTSSAFSILHPWCNATHSSLALRSIASEAQRYVRAIEHSITAAQQGYDMVQEVIAETVPEKESQEFAQGMLTIAIHGKDNAQKASESFVDVRWRIEKLLKTAKAEQTASAMAVDESNSAVLIDLEQGISVLENFRVCVSVYISWWKRMDLSNSAQSTSLEMLRVNYDSLRNSITVQKWKDLRQLYVDYSEKIQAVHDQYPDFMITVDAAADQQWFDLSNSARSNLMQDEPIEPMLHELEKRSLAQVLTMRLANVGSTVATRVRTSTLGKPRFKDTKISQLNPPDGLNMNSLIEATERAFKVVVAWCRTESEPGPSSALTEQMHNYGGAISRSILSAQTVFTLAGEAIAFVDQLEKSTTPEEIHRFLTGMANLAQQGLLNTEKALAAFKDVRTKLISLANGTSTGVDRDHLFSLEKNGEVLEIFIESVSRYVTWWTRMHMSMSQQADSSEELSKMYSAVRKGNVKRKWKKLATDFQEYADKMRLLQDGNPDVFAQWMKTASSSIINHP